MKKIKILLISILSLVLSSTLFANPYSVNFRNIDRNDIGTMTALNGFFQVYEDVRYFHQGIDPYSVRETKKTYEFFHNKKNKNIDEVLLEAIAYRCLYNCDLVEEEDILDYFEKLTKKYKKTPEVFWIYGNLLAQMKPSVKAMNTIETYLYMNKGNINIWFLEDYAYCCAVNGSLFAAKDALETLASQIGFNVNEHPIYGMINEHIITTDTTKTYDANEVFYYYKSDAHERLVSTMFGISFPFNGSIQPKIFIGPDGNKPAIICYESPSIKTKKGDIFYSTIISLYNSDYSVEEIESTMIKDPSQIVSTTYTTIENVEYKIVVFEFEGIYDDDIRKGAKGMIITAKLDRDPYSELKTEFPLVASYADNNPDAAYSRIVPSYTRVDGTVTLGIIIDSCNAIFPQTEKEVKAWLKEIRFN